MPKVENPTCVRTSTLAELRRQIARIERDHKDGGEAAEAACPTGFAEIDAQLPGGGLRRGALHEIASSTALSRGAATGFVTHLAAHFAGIGGVVVWCLRGHDLYGPGLGAYGLDHRRLIVARGTNADAVLWAMEEGLASGAPAAVIGEPGRMPDKAALTAHRRLQLAAERHDVAALLLTDEAAAQTPAVSRWRVASVPGGHWQVDLVKGRGARPGSWTIHATDPLTPAFVFDVKHDQPYISDETADFGALVPEAGDRSAA